MRSTHVALALALVSVVWAQWLNAGRCVVPLANASRASSYAIELGALVCVPAPWSPGARTA